MDRFPIFPKKIGNGADALSDFVGSDAWRGRCGVRLCRDGLGREGPLEIVRRDVGRCGGLLVTSHSH
jgi:hypothetical protein